MSYKLNDREVEINETQPDDGSILICSANYVDNGTELTESELEELEAKYSEDLYQDYMEGRADALHDQMKEGY